MNRRRKDKNIICSPQSRVKGMIVSAGVPMWRLARDAGISQSLLSQCLSGDRGALKTQVKVFRAFRRLSGYQGRLAEFWGELLSERVA